MSLKEYKKKRDFSKTPEPKGKEKKKKTKNQGKFIVQKHDASRLHYDFRLEINGVLKSWAIPKGPSMNPEEKHLAVATEDHPLEYLNFEGIIKEGYGKGAVIIWDRGTYKNLKDISMDKAYKKGDIKIELRGKKLKGGFALINSKFNGKKKNWILIKIKDKYAKKQDILKKDKSVKSGKTIKQIKKNENRKS